MPLSAVTPKLFQFIDRNGKRQSIRLGKMTQKNFDFVRVRLDHLVAAQRSGMAPDSDRPAVPGVEAALGRVIRPGRTGGEFVITRYRDMEANLRTQLLKIIARAGLKASPRP